MVLFQSKISVADAIEALMYWAIIIVTIAVVVFCMPVHAETFAYIAQNDPAQFQVTNPQGTCWYFPDSERIEQQKIYDQPSTTIGINTYCTLTSAQTANMREGKYTLIYTYPARLAESVVPPKYLKDISWNNSMLVSTFGKTTDEHGKQSFMVMADLKAMTNSSPTDKIEEYWIYIQPPVLTITRHEQVAEDVISVYGESNFADGTPITIKVDEWEHNNQPDAKNFTFKTNVSRKYTSQNGYWECNMSLPIQEMFPGWHTTSVYANGLQTSVRFPIYQAWTQMPTPTQYINYFGNGSIKPDIVTVTVIQVQTRIIDRWHTATATPPVTDALGDVIDYPYSRGATIPSWIWVLALVVMGVIVMVRDTKWK